MNVTFVMLGVQTTHTIADEDKRPINGDIITAYPTSEITEPANPNKRTVFIKVTGAPERDIADFRKLASPLHDIDLNIVKPHRYFLDSTEADPAGMQALATNREIEVTWSRFKELCKDKVTGLVITDAALDG